MASGSVFQDSPTVNSVSSAATIGDPTFRDLNDIYYADTCEPLTEAVKSGAIQMSALARGHYPGQPLRPNEVPGLRTVGLWDASQQQDWGLDWHRNEGIEITYLARGSLDFAVDDREWQLQSGQVTITRPWQRHRVGKPNVGPSRLHWCIIDVDVRRPNQQWIWPDWVALSNDDRQRDCRHNKRSQARGLCSHHGSGPEREERPDTDAERGGAQQPHRHHSGQSSARPADGESRREFATHGRCHGCAQREHAGQRDNQGADRQLHEHFRALTLAFHGIFCHSACRRDLVDLQSREGFHALKLLADPRRVAWDMCAHQSPQCDG